MFICRHVLLRAYIPRHATTLYAARRPLSCTLPLFGPKIYAAAPASGPPSGDAGRVQQSTDSARDEGTVRPPNTDEARHDITRSDKQPLLPPWLLDEAALQTEVASERAGTPNSVGARHPHDDPLDAYLTWRREADFLRDFGHDPHKIFEVLEAAATKRRADVIRLLVVDVVESGHFLSQSLRITCTERLLLLAAEGLLSKNQAITLFESIQSFARLTTISDTTKVTVAAAFSAMPRNPELDPQLLDIFAFLLLDYVNNGMTHAAARTQPRALSSRAISVMYLLAYDLAALGLQERSLEVMQALVKAQKLSSYAIENADLSSGDYVRIVFSALVRSSTAWGWRRLSSDLIQRVLPTMDPITDDVGELAMEVLQSLVEDTTEATISTAAAIIVQLMERCPGHQIPQSVLQDFYAGTQRHRLAELAEMVYSVSQSDLVRTEHGHAYPPPGKGMLYWFLRFLTGKQKNTHLPRVLARQLVDEDIPVAQQFRGPVIAILAGQGLATHARALWERYADSKESDLLVGNASAMLRLVSLFMSLHRRSDYLAFTKSAVQSAGPGADVVDAAVAHTVREGSAIRSARAGSGPSSPVAGLTLFGEPDFGNTAPKDSQNASLQASVVGEDGSGMHCTQVTECSLPEGSLHALAVDGDPKVVNELAAATRAPDGDLPAKSDPVLALSAERTEAGAGDRRARLSGLSADEAKRKAGEFKDFAERVFNAFRRSRAPFRQAHHWELNALARASFMLGRLEEGLDVFRQLLRAHQVPDMQDINVALGVLAEHNPTAAANVIERMVRMGIEPDAVSFGSVIHHAIIHGDMPLVSALIRRSRELGIKQLSYKTIGTLLRAAVSVPEEDGRVSPRTQLQNTRALVDSLLLAGRVPSPNMGRDCVLAALRADDAGAAFRFWQLLMKDKTEWDDESQATTRHLIARRVRKHLAAGWLDESKARLMLHELREPLHPLGGMRAPRRPSGRGRTGED